MKKKKLLITILMDNPHSWFAPFADRLAEQLRERGHTVGRVAHPEELPKGDCAFFLSVEGIVPAPLLSRHAHNIVIHASAVPKGKGWSPLTWQILEGKSEIVVSLFEAAEHVDSGNVYDREIVQFDGSELVDELRKKEADAVLSLALRFVDNYPPSIGEKQAAEGPFYPRRKPEDSELDTNKTIAQVFNQLRVADNERYPALFTHRGCKYILKIYKEKDQI